VANKLMMMMLCASSLKIIALQVERLKQYTHQQ